MSHVFIKLNSFQYLKKGWCYGEGGPISLSNIKSASRIIMESVSYGLGELDVFPGLNNEVAVSIYDGENHLEFIIENTGTVTFTHEFNNEEISYKENIPLSTAIYEIRHYMEKKKICAMSGFSTSSITIAESKGSQALRLNHPVTAAVFRSLIKDVRKDVAAPRSADIFLSSMRRYVDPRLCFGS